MNARSGIVISCACGLGNLGDEAMLRALLRELRENCPGEEITVLSRNPAETAASHGVAAIHSFALPALRKKLKTARLFLSGGGNLLQDVTGTPSLLYYLLTLKMAHTAGCRVFLCGAGIGPIRSDTNLRRVKKALSACADGALLREEADDVYLDRYGLRGKAVFTGGDLSLLLLPPEAAAPPAGKRAVFCLKAGAGFDVSAPVLAAAADYARDSLGLFPCFLSANPREDDAAAGAVTALMKGRHEMLPPCHSPEEFTQALSGAALTVSQRLHGLVLSAGQGVPVVGIASDGKLDAFLRMAGLPKPLPAACLTEQALCSAMENALRADTAPAAERLRFLALQSREHLRQLLQK